MANAALEDVPARTNKLTDPFPVGGFTVDDVMSWDDGKRWELIDGIPRMMATPGIAHESMVEGLLEQLRIYFRGKPCAAFGSNTGVVLFPDREKSKQQFVIPDLKVVCDREKIKPDNIYGSPDFVIEILSKGSKGYDFGEKKDVYEEAGIKEYWAIDSSMVYRFHLVDGKYSQAKYDMVFGLTLEPVIFPGFRIIFDGDLFYS